MIAWLVETLIVTSALLALVMLLRNPVQQMFGAKVAYALWLLPALRMVSPPIASLMPDTPALTHMTQHGSALTHLIRQRVTQFDAGPAEQAASSGLSWMLALVALWLIGALGFAVWQIISYRRFTQKILTGARVRRSPAKGIKLLASPRISGPIAFGLTRRFIIFPHDALTRFDVEEHAMALAHELAHHRRGDLIANAVALGFLAFHWCNPLAWIAHRAFRTDQEMACDADVIDAIRDKGLGHAYGRALVKCAAGRRDYAAICHLATVDRLKRRLSMLSKKTPSMRRRFAGLALTGTVVLTGLALTASGEGMAAQVGAKVSQALPIAQKATLLPSLSAVPAALAAASNTEIKATRSQQLALATSAAAAEEDSPPAPPAPPAPPSLADVPAPPAPPAPPALAGMPPVPPAPPAPVAAPSPRSIPAPAADARRYRYAYKVDREFSRNVPSEDEIQAMVPIVEVSEGTGCGGARELVNTSEETVSVDGKQRKKISIRICGKDIAQKARADAIRGMQEARADIQQENDLSQRIRDRIIADLDRQIARMRSERD
ncbi:beta-lactamase regulating signal transducer with metallopeptidase domain [Sphingobium xanthum]|uniref:M56 family metallopeptidase n=1 Tax=Sphingobium xanthum TaxID=1387165 RepID=UPI001C8B335E|nr:M56 family metallopeptidase [Sphingobium xanthum]